MSSARALDLVVWGATGFTGRLVCEHLSKNHTPAVRWAMAGRNKARFANPSQLRPAAPSDEFSRNSHALRLRRRSWRR